MMEKENLSIYLLESDSIGENQIVRVRVEINKELLSGLMEENNLVALPLEFAWRSQVFKDNFDQDGICETTLKLPLKAPEYDDLTARVKTGNAYKYEIKQQIPPLEKVQTEFRDKIVQQLVVEYGQRVRIAEGTYRITHHIVVQSGASLIIDPGVHLAFAPGIGIYCQGAIYAIGEKKENRYIHFSQTEEGKWAGIALNGMRAAKSRFNYCGIESGSGCSVTIVKGFADRTNPSGPRRGGGLQILDTGFDDSVSIEGCSFKNCEAEQGGGIAVYNGRISLKEAYFENNRATRSGGGLHVQHGEVDFLEKVGFVENHAEVAGGAMALVNGTKFNGVPSFESNICKNNKSDVFLLRTEGEYSGWKANIVSIK